MSLSTGLNIAKSALALVSTETAIVSRNLAGASDENYVKRGVATLNIPGAGVFPDHITRASNQALLQTMIDSSSSASSKRALLEGLDVLHQTVNDPELGNTVGARLSELANALNLYSEAPGDLSRGHGVVERASELARTLNVASDSVVRVRQQADADMASSVERINSLLVEFESLNGEIVRSADTRVDVTDAMDQRDRILKELSGEIGIKTVDRSGGLDIAIYTDSGVTLFDRRARDVTFSATVPFSASTAGNAVYVDGVDVTSSNAVLPINNGRLAGLAELRDNAAVTYQTQLDETARGLVEAFAEVDQAAVLADQTGLFTYSGGPAVPAAGTHVLGLASEISVNTAVNPAVGGSVELIRDGGINGATYVENPTGGVGFDGRINRLISGLDTDRSFDTSAGLPSTTSLSGYANASSSWLEQLRSDTNNDANFRETLEAHSKAALSNATGVNLDEELASLLELERAYQASARLIASIDEMFDTLLSAAA